VTHPGENGTSRSRGVVAGGFDALLDGEDARLRVCQSDSELAVCSPGARRELPAVAHKPAGVLVREVVVLVFCALVPCCSRGLGRRPRKFRHGGYATLLNFARATDSVA
jgi:hypothetical protein